MSGGREVTSPVVALVTVRLANTTAGELGGGTAAALEALAGSEAVVPENEADEVA
jgi:hypothetical protein